MNLFVMLAMYLFNRAQEPSTHAGLGGVAIALGQMFPAYSELFNTGGAFLCAVGAMMAERKAKAG